MRSFNDKAAHSGETLNSLGDFLLHPVEGMTSTQRLKYLYLLTPDQMAADVSILPKPANWHTGDAFLALVIQAAQTAKDCPEDLELRRFVRELLTMFSYAGIEAMKGKTL